MVNVLGNVLCEGEIEPSAGTSSVWIEQYFIVVYLYCSSTQLLWGCWTWTSEIPSLKANMWQ